MRTRKRKGSRGGRGVKGSMSRAEGWLARARGRGATLPPMHYRNAEDRLNPITPEGVDRHHARRLPGGARARAGVRGRRRRAVHRRDGDRRQRRSPDGAVDRVPRLRALGRDGHGGHGPPGNRRPGDRRSETEAGARAAVEALPLTDVTRDRSTRPSQRKRTEADGRLSAPAARTLHPKHPSTCSRRAFSSSARARAAKNGGDRHAVSRSMAQRFVAGDTLEEAIEAARALNAGGAHRQRSTSWANR